MDYTIVSGDDGKVITVDTRNEPASVQLPAPSAGFKVTIKDIGGSASVNKISIIRNANELIDGVGADTELAEDFGTLSLSFDGTNWTRFDAFKRIGYLATGRGLFAGGWNGALVQTIEYIEFATISNSSNFGNLIAASDGGTGVASSTRGIFTEGFTTVTSALIEYVTISTLGNALNFGNLSQTRLTCGGCSSQTRGVFGGGDTSQGNGFPGVNTIDYISIHALGNAADFGDLTLARTDLAGCGSSTRGMFGGGQSNTTNTNTIDYVTIATLGNAIDFGDLLAARNRVASCSNHLRATWAGGAIPGISDGIDYVEIATLSNAANFGNLTFARVYFSGCSSALRGVFNGGINNPTFYNTIDYIVFATVGNAADFGDLSTTKYIGSANSSSHGGLYV